MPGMKMPNPLLEQLTKEEKATLKKIHEQYSKFETASLATVVNEGEQTFDLKLK